MGRLDFSGDDMTQRQNLVEGTKAFLPKLHEKGVMASVSVKVFANDNEAYEIQDFTLAYRDLLDFNPVLDDLLEIPPPLDGSGRNLNGVLVASKEELDTKIDNLNSEKFGTVC